MYHDSICVIIIEGQVPYNVSVNATNMAGTGSAEVMIMFTEEGSKCE